MSCRMRGSAEEKTTVCDGQILSDFKISPLLAPFFGRRMPSFGVRPQSAHSPVTLSRSHTLLGTTGVSIASI